LGGKLNILNAEYFDFLHSTISQLFSQIQVNAIKIDSLTVHNFYQKQVLRLLALGTEKLATPLLNYGDDNR